MRPRSFALKRSVGVAPTDSSATSMPAAFARAASVVRISSSFAAIDGQFVFRRRVVAVAGVAQQPAEPQAGQRRDRADEVERAGASGSMPQRWKPTSTFTSTSSVRPARAIASDQPRATRRVIDDDRHRRAVHQRHQPRGVRRVHRIGQADVVDAGVGEHFGLAELRAADADGAALDLPARDDRRLVRLGVRPEPRAGGGGERLRAVEVVQETRAIDEDLRRRKLIEAHGPYFTIAPNKPPRRHEDREETYLAS